MDRMALKQNIQSTKNNWHLEKINLSGLSQGIYTWYISSAETATLRRNTNLQKFVIER